MEENKTLWDIYTAFRKAVEAQGIVNVRPSVTIRIEYNVQPYRLSVEIYESEMYPNGYIVALRGGLSNEFTWRTLISGTVLSSALNLSAVVAETVNVFRGFVAKALEKGRG